MRMCIKHRSFLRSSVVFVGARASLGVPQPGFDVLVKAIRSGNAYVKISAAYRISYQASAYPDVAPLAQALIAPKSSACSVGDRRAHQIHRE